MDDPLELVAFDIETTGFAVDSEVTVAGFAVPIGVRVFCQTGSEHEHGLEDEVQAAVETTVKVSTHASETALLEAMAEFTAERLQRRDVLLIAYNGETWRGGFDLPFLRTRLAATGTDWPFADVPYADLLPVIRDRFNTTVSDGDDAASAADLETAYDVLCEGDFGEVDPFEDSSAAIEAFQEGRYVDLVLHNVADVLRTRALGRLAQRYCSNSEFSLKSLTPVDT